MDDHPDFFVDSHDADNGALRLLHSPPGDENTGKRCRKHSDCGTLTLLLNNGVGGWGPMWTGDGGRCRTWRAASW